MNGLTIRPMTHGDVAAVTRLAIQLGYGVDESAIERRLQRYATAESHLLVVAERDGVVVGWAHALERPLLQEPLHAELGGLVVDESIRGVGIGAAMLGVVEEWASEHGYHGLWLHSRVERPEAHGFYPGKGFERIKTSHVYYRTLPNAQ